MSIKTVYECDICEMERREANHWFVATPIDDAGVAIFPWASMPNSKDKKATHLCGESCVIAFMSRFLLDSMPKPPEPPEVLPLITGSNDDIPW